MRERLSDKIIGEEMYDASVGYLHDVENGKVSQKEGIY